MPGIGIRGLAIGGQRAGGFSPNSLFAAGEAGDWFDPSDLSKMWQDTAGTTPVTADGQSVARIDGQRGVVSLRQATAANRSLYKTSGGLHWLQFDGVNDGFASASALNMSGTDKVTVCIGARKNSDTSEQWVTELSNGTASNRFGINVTGASLAQWGAVSGGSTARFASTPASYAAPITNILTELGDISGDSVKIRANGAQVNETTTDQGTGNYTSDTLYVGMRGLGPGAFFNGNIYFLLIRGALTSGANLTNLERLAGQKCGVTI
jgi:hypothetical protein